MIISVVNLFKAVKGSVYTVPGSTKARRFLLPHIACCKLCDVSFTLGQSEPSIHALATWPGLRWQVMGRDRQEKHCTQLWCDCHASLCPPAPTNPPWRRIISPSSSTRNRGTLGWTRSSSPVCGRTRSRLWLTNTSHALRIQTEVRFIDDNPFFIRMTHRI